MVDNSAHIDYTGSIVNEELKMLNEILKSVRTKLETNFNLSEVEMAKMIVAISDAHVEDSMFSLDSIFDSFVDILQDQMLASTIYREVF
jgi:predicted tellurium resistance membrane protein TerC